MAKSVLDGLTFNDGVSRPSASVPPVSVETPGRVVGNLEEAIDLACPLGTKKPRIYVDEPSRFDRLMEYVPDKVKIKAKRYALLFGLPFLLGGFMGSNCNAYDFSFSNYGRACDRQGYIAATLAPPAHYATYVVIGLFSSDPGFAKPKKVAIDTNRIDPNLGKFHSPCKGKGCKK